MSTPGDWHYPWSVSVYVDAPVLNGQLSISDWSEAIDYVESMPLYRFWLDSLSSRERRAALPLSRWHVDRSGASALRKLNKRALEEERRMAQSNDLASISLGQMVEIEDSPERWTWAYDFSFGFTAHVETREFMDGWGGGPSSSVAVAAHFLRCARRSLAIYPPAARGRPSRWYRPYRRRPSRVPS